MFVGRRIFWNLCVFAYMCVCVDMWMHIGLDTHVLAHDLCSVCGLKKRFTSMHSCFTNIGPEYLSCWVTVMRTVGSRWFLSWNQWQAGWRPVRRAGRLGLGNNCSSVCPWGPVMAKVASIFVGLYHNLSRKNSWCNTVYVLVWCCSVALEDGQLL